MVCAVMTVLSCTEQSPLRFVERDGTYVPEPRSVAAFSEALRKADAEKAAAMLGKAFAEADSLGALKATSETVSRLSDGLFSVLAAPGASDYDYALAEMMLEREALCTTLDPIDFKRIDYKYGRLNLNRPGLLVNNFPVQGIDGGECMLRDLFTRRTVLFVYGSACDECDRMLSQIAKSSFIKNVKKGEDINLVALYAGEDRKEFASKAAALEGWTNVMDRDNVIAVDNAFDSGLVPSFYLISESGIVDVKAARSLKDIEKADAAARSTCIDIVLDPDERVWGGEDSRWTVYAVPGQFIPDTVRERRKPGPASHPHKQRTLRMERPAVQI